MLTLVLAAVAGTAHALSFAPWDRPGLQLAALAALVALAERQRSALGAARVGWLLGRGGWGTGPSWFYISGPSQGDLRAGIAALATSGVVSLLAVFPALAAGAAHRRAADPPLRLLLAWPG